MLDFFEFVHLIRYTFNCPFRLLQARAVLISDLRLQIPPN